MVYKMLIQSDSFSEYDALKFSALLHNIGEFLEWAGPEKDDEMRDEGCAHPQIGAKFLKSINFDPLIVDLVRHHHDSNLLEDKNKRYLCKIIQLSDRLSSGERTTTKNEIETPTKYRRMVSVFNRVFTEDGKIPSYENLYKYKMRELDFNSSVIFPEKNAFDADSYKSLLKQFKADMQKLNKKDFTALFFLLQKYWWCVPSATYSSNEKYFPDVSLFDRSKTTCAIALCLYKQEITEEELDKLIKEDGSISNEPKFCLIHGDLPSIQNFVYTITTKSAAKSLKGRSLFLVLLQRFIAEHILKNLDLPLTNLIYSGGGHFYILAPKKLCELNLDEIKKEINKKLFKRFKTRLYLVLDYAEVCAKDFKNFADKWKEAAENTSKQKAKKYWEFESHEIFEPFDEGGEKEICDICGVEINIAKKDKEDNKCEACRQFINVSDYLKSVQDNGYFEISETKKELEILGEFETFLDGKIFLNPPKGVPFFCIPVGIPTIIKEENGCCKREIKQFTEMADDAEKDTGTNKIGILKMDVDNLGNIFAKGLGNNATLSRVSTLSSFFSFFFEGYLNELVKEKYRDNIYLIYAGGDDTFVVGRWDKLIDFAYDVYKDFRKYTCNNPNITLSAGIVIVDPKYPVKRFADKVDNELERAKELKEKGHEKNSICIFGQPIKWSIDEDKSVNDFEMMKEIEKILVKCIGEGAQRELIQRVKISAKELKRALGPKGKSKSIDINAYWRLLYYFKRNYKDKNENWKYEGIGLLINKLYKEIINNYVFKRNTKYNIDLITIAARIAELKTRNTH